jgi:hypothetical protein
LWPCADEEMKMKVFPEFHISVFSAPPKNIIFSRFLESPCRVPILFYFGYLAIIPDKDIAVVVGVYIILSNLTSLGRKAAIGIKK